MKLTVAATIFVLLSGTAAWGELGHETVGCFLAPQALKFVQTSLKADYNSSLGPAAPWADTVREEKAYKWSAPLHFVDAEDSPLQGQCSVSESRDCGNGECIRTLCLTAIANYTTRVQDTSLSTTQRTEALKFLGEQHFIGDIGQPLHVEAYEVGGNDIDAVCSGDKTNLHAVHTGMVEKNVDDNHEGTPQSYASDLVAAIKTGKYKSNAASWITCSSITEPVPTSSILDLTFANMISGRATIKPLACPLAWAQDANSFDCTAVFNFTTGEDLCTSTYFTNVVPIIDMQLAKQGYRLAAWLNVIFDGATNL
ncbi:nuclease Le1 [Ramaria rubella]|nr:nuclease Le1 [Ramaria rubella]